MTEYVYLVGHSGPEHNNVIHICSDFDTAVSKWKEVQQELISKAEDRLKWNLEEYGEVSEMYCRIISNLNKTDYDGNPIKVGEDCWNADNYPFDTPYILRKEVEK